jgi:hypothetical protein
VLPDQYRRAKIGLQMLYAASALASLRAA